MKTEELTALGITPEQAASVLAINGKDIEKLKTANEAQKTELDTLKPQLAEAGKTIEGFKALDIEGIKRTAEEYKVKAEKAEQDAAAKIAELQFNNLLDGSITAAKGKNSKAIRALLDLEAIGKSKNQSEDIAKALEALKADSGYLFDSEGAPAPRVVGKTTSTPTAPSKEALKNMSYKERVDLKTTDPQLYNSIKE